MIMTKEYNKLDKTFNLTPEVEVLNTPEGGCATRQDQLTDVTPGGLKKPDRLTQTDVEKDYEYTRGCLLYTSPSPRDRQKSRMPSSA